MAQDTERDKMLRGEWYDANFDEALLKERLTAERRSKISSEEKFPTA